MSFGFGASAVIIQAQGMATKAAELAADPRIPPELRPIFARWAADAKRTADGVEQLVKQGKDRRPLVIGTIVGIAGVAVAIWQAVS